MLATYADFDSALNCVRYSYIHLGGFAELEVPLQNYRTFSTIKLLVAFNEAV